MTTSIPVADRFLLPTPPVVRLVWMDSPAEEVADWEFPFMKMIALCREVDEVKVNRGR